MPNADDLCVEYVLNELDPSEIVMVERAMESDMNLLIEIECLRRTLKRLEQLPRHSPPANLRDTIIHQAVTHYHDNRRSLFPRWSNTTTMATAAAVMFSVMVSIINFYPEDAGLLPQNAGESGSSMNEAEEMSPWVDYNNILHINQTTSSGPDVNISIGGTDLQNSLQKLVPVQNSTSSRPDMGDIQLTRTSN
ncbi:MAG: hypothetical protein WEB89_03605 [Balneolales bacterium]